MIKLNSITRIELNEYLQSDIAECGLMCLGAAAHLMGSTHGVRSLRRLGETSLRGATASNLVETAAQLGMTARAVRCDFSLLGSIPTPSILHWNNKHFVVLVSARRGRYEIFDPAVGLKMIDGSELKARYTGFAIELYPSRQFKALKPEAPAGVLDVLRALQLPKLGLTQLIVLSAIAQVIGLISPLLMQLAVNRAAHRGTDDLLLALCAGFGLVYIVGFLVDSWRGILNHRITSQLSWEFSRRVFRHMIFLPLGWFQRRRLADSVSRLDSLDPIKQALTGGLIVAVVDGAFCMILLGLLLFISPSLTGIVAVGVIGNAAIKLSTAGVTSRLSAEAFSARMSEQSNRLESFRAIQSIKLAGGERKREQEWAHSFIRGIVSADRLNVVTTFSRTSGALLSGLLLVAIVYVGIGQINAGTLSIGALFTFAIYRRYFIDKTSTALDQVISTIFLRYHTNRIAEVLDAASEVEHALSPAHIEPISGLVRLENIYYRYSTTDQYVLKGIDAIIEPGQFVVIIGASGTGKSTLLKLICCLEEPSAGSVHFDGIRADRARLHELRKQIGAVMQDDELIPGTILENVTAFDDNPDVERARSALKAALMLDEVMAFPMGLETVVGERGSAISGGQRQRIMLARALYKRPAVLVLDEATANIDPSREKAIYNNLKALRSTKIVVTHRQEVAGIADRVFVLSDRGLRENARLIEAIA